MTPPDADGAARRCEQCRKPLVRRQKENSNNWSRRRYCNAECSNAAQKAKVQHALDALPPRYCEAPGCGKLLIPHGHEGPLSFAKRRCCNMECRRLLAVDVMRDRAAKGLTRGKLVYQVAYRDPAWAARFDRPDRVVHTVAAGSIGHPEPAFVPRSRE